MAERAGDNIIQNLGGTPDNTPRNPLVEGRRRRTRGGQPPEATSAAVPTPIPDAIAPSPAARANEPRVAHWGAQADQDAQRNSGTIAPTPDNQRAPHQATRRFQLPGGKWGFSSRGSAALQHGEERIDANGQPLAPDPLRPPTHATPANPNIPTPPDVYDRSNRKSFVTKETAIAAGGFALGLTARAIATRLNLPVEAISDALRVMPILSQGATVGGIALEAVGLVASRLSRTNAEAEANWQKFTTAMRWIRRTGEFFSLAAFGDKVASAGQTVEHTVHQAPVTPTPTENPPTPTSTLDHPTATTVAAAGTPVPHLTATGTPIPHETPTHVVPTETPTTAPTHKVDATPTLPPTPTPTATPTHVATPGASSPIDTNPVTAPGNGHQEPGVGGNGGAGTTGPDSGGGSTIHPGQIEPGDTGTAGGTAPLEVTGTGTGTHAMEDVATQALEDIKPIDTMHNGHHIQGTVGEDLKFDGKDWDLAGNGEKNLRILAEHAGLPTDFTLDHDKYNAYLQHCVTLWANGELNPQDHPLEYAMFNGANGTESTWGTIQAQAPQIMENLQTHRPEIFIHPQADVPETQPASPLVAVNPGEDTPAQTTQQVVDQIDQLHTPATQGTIPLEDTTGQPLHTDTPVATTHTGFPDNTTAPAVPLSTLASTVGDVLVHPGDNHVVSEILHTNMIDHVTAQTGVVVDGQLGNPEHPLTYGELTWDLQNPAKEAEVYQAFIDQTGLPIDQQSFHHTLEQLLNDAAYTWAKGELDDYSAKGLIFHWFNGTESMQEHFAAPENQSVIRESFEKLIAEHPELLDIPDQAPYTNIPPTAQMPDNVVPFPGRAAEPNNVIPFPNRAQEDRQAA